jgi:serine/threonine protein kinase/tetratricopeptide (TPR) repeat protein
MQDISTTRVRLGSFELNLQTGDLCPIGGKNGTLLRDQPLQVLKILIERRGKLVTREEIRRLLWPNDTIVDFEHGINVSIGILRRELGDSAGNPQYIETLPRKGYRLLAAVEALESQTGLEPPLPASPPRTSTAPAAMIGRRVSHYRILEVIGGGGMGMVYKAEDLKLGRRVAVKFLPEELADDPTALRRFEREAQTASALNHLNICTVYEVEEADGHPFIVMELLEGETLARRLDVTESKILPVADVLQIGIQICAGLQAAHDKGIIHRDIKPANIFLTSHGTAKILDFGLAKLAASQEVGQPVDDVSMAADSGNGTGMVNKAAAADLTRAGVALGTIGYMSPEQVRREELGTVSDIFSFGLVLYEALSGKRGFPGETAPIVQESILRDTPDPPSRSNPEVPRGLDAVLEKMLRKDPSQRFQTAGEVSNALEQVARKSSLETRRRLTSLAACIALAAIALGVWGLWYRHPGPILTPDDTVVIASTNHTNDPVFNDALYTALGLDLEQSPYVHVFAENKVVAALLELHNSNLFDRSRETARKVCLHTGGKLMVVTSIEEQGNGFAIELDAIRCDSNKTVASTRSYALARSDVIHELGVTISRLRVELGEPASALAKFNVPAETAVSASPEAIQLLLDGYKSALSSDFPGSIPKYHRALQLDPNFALAWAALAGAEAPYAPTAESRFAGEHAFALRDRVTAPSRFQIENIYYTSGTGDELKACYIAAQWVKNYPDDFAAHHNFIRCLLHIGRLDQALAEARETVRLMPAVFTYSELVQGSIYTGHFTDALAALDEARQRGFDSGEWQAFRSLLGFFRRDERPMQEASKWAVDHPRDVEAAYIADGLAFASGYYGHLNELARYSDQALSIAQSTKNPHEAAEFMSDRAAEEAEVGHAAEAKRLATAAMTTTDRNIRLLLAFALARADDINTARRITLEEDHAAPSDTDVQFYSLPAVRAAIALQQKNPLQAIEALRPTSDYELAVPDGISNMYPSYLRGLAYLQLHQGRQAAAEFQKLIDHPGIVSRNVTGALTRLQMARAQQMAGDTTSALHYYEEFLSLWKDADPDLQPLREAKAEYARLKTSHTSE